MKPFYDFDGITIFLGDCREILPTVELANCILSDPPYGINYVTSRRSQDDPLKKKIANDSDLQCVSEAWDLALEQLRENSHWYAFASPRMIPVAASVFSGFKHILAWDKGDRGTVGDLTCGFGEAWQEKERAREMTLLLDWQRVFEGTHRIRTEKTAISREVSTCLISALEYFERVGEGFDVE